MGHYANPNKAKHAANVATFDRMMARFPWMKLTKPSPEKAPWHEQAVLTTDNGYHIIINFWPCSMTAQRDGEKSVEGEEAIRLMISQAIDDCRDREPVDLIDDGDQARSSFEPEAGI